jgi:hypothetical protein
MIVPGSASPLLASAGGYNLTKSLRFRSSVSAYLQRTPASAATSRRIMTYSVWAKIGTLGTQRLFYEGYTSVSDLEYFMFNSSNQLEWSGQVNGGTSYGVRTPAVFRDPSAWYHVVIAIDTTQATDTNRIKIYVNGVQQTGLTTFYSGFPAQNTDLEWNNQSSTQVIGWGGHTGYYDGYMTEINMFDGQQLTPSSFGETSATTGVWIPKKYTGTYGTNGFYLPFTDNSALTTSSNVGLGKDFSGNSNYWTTNGISITSGSTYDSMTDVPTLTNSTTANYATWNPLNKVASGSTLSNGNLTVAQTTDFSGVTGTIGVSSGKYYVEYTFSGSSVYGEFGFNDGTLPPYANLTPRGTNYVFYCSFASISSKAYRWTGGSSATPTNYITNTSVLGIAIDCDAGKVWFSIDGTFQDSGNPVTGANPNGTFTAGATMFPYFNNGTSITVNLNCGQRSFSATPPTGFKALNTFNLTTPTITQSNKNFDVTTFTGNASTNVIVNSGLMQPDMVWLKSRTNANNHTLFDSIRGVNNLLYPNLPNDAATGSAQLTAFNSNGFTLGASENSNDSFGELSVGWQWRASNAAGVSNTAGTIASTVSANTTAGFSIVTYSANGSTGTVGHGLGVTPSMIIVKKRNAAERWTVFHTSTSNAYLYLNETFAAETSNANTRFGNNTVVVQPTDSVFTIGSSNDVNGTSGTYVAYCFAEVAGYSKFGSYTGTGAGDSNGPFIYCGFRPALVIIKVNTAGYNWAMMDTDRPGYNSISYRIMADVSNEETTVGDPQLDFLSNGFKLRAGNANYAGTVYYIAFAENPFKYANAR